MENVNNNLTRHFSEFIGSFSFFLRCFHFSLSQIYWIAEKNMAISSLEEGDGEGDRNDSWGTVTPSREGDSWKAY